MARRSLTLAGVESRRSRAVAWVKDDPFGVEFAEIDMAEYDQLEQATLDAMQQGARG